MESKKKPTFLALSLSSTQVTEKKRKGPKVERAPFENRPKKKKNKARSSIELRHSKNSIKSWINKQTLKNKQKSNFYVKDSSDLNRTITKESITISNATKHDKIPKRISIS